MRRMRWSCCARATAGHATALPNPATNSRCASTTSTRRRASVSRVLCRFLPDEAARLRMIGTAASQARAATIATNDVAADLTTQFRADSRFGSIATFPVPSVMSGSTGSRPGPNCDIDVIGQIRTCAENCRVCTMTDRPVIVTL
jgi:hypothetical protein